MVVQLWGALFQLMQDENEDIRIAASALAWSIVRSKEEMQPLVRSEVETVCRSERPDTIVAMLVARLVLCACNLLNIWQQICCKPI